MSNLDSDHQEACACKYQCTNGNCASYCGYSGASGKRHLLGMNGIEA